MTATRRCNRFPGQTRGGQRLRSAVRDHAKETAEVLGRGREAAEAKSVTKAEAVDAAMKAAHAAKTPKDDAPVATGAATLAHGPRSDDAAAKDTKGAKKAPKAKGEAKKRDGMSGPDAAAKVLAEAGKPMNCKAVVETMLAKGLWKTGGKTPAATIYTPQSSGKSRRRARTLGSGRPTGACSNWHSSGTLHSHAPGIDCRGFFFLSHG